MTSNKTSDTSELDDGDGYFRTHPAPSSIGTYKKLARNFVLEQMQGSRKVVLVTSGGTTVPLENHTVRFIDNFSAGTRGATSAEYFLDAGYAVIFLHRQFSLLPYSRHYSHSTNCFLDFISENDRGELVVDPDYQEQMRGVLRKYKEARKKHCLLLLSFSTVTEYLWSLKEIALLMRPLGPNAMFYLAAAVSDFFLPTGRMAEHKIQSSGANGTAHSDDSSAETPQASPRSSQRLLIDLDPVPKFLKSLVDGWAPEGMIVSFKLETDPALLVPKARQALAKYSHHLVIGNFLSSRKYEVIFVTPQDEHWIKVPHHRRVPSMTGPSMAEHTAALNSRSEPAISETPVEIESLIVSEVTAMHSRFVQHVHEGNEIDEQNMLANALAWAEFGTD